MNNWNDLNVTPPNKIVEIKDENGNVAKAHPTYYPFDSKLKPCKPCWDGGWLIECEGITCIIDSKIIKWREL